MREIKFRFWDTRKNNLRWCDTSHWLPPTVQFTVNKIFAFAKKDEIVAQQYTGLKDKNGVEIYEGDIVQHYAFDEGDTFAVEWYDKGGYWLGHGCFSEWDRCSIVGNIFEGVDKCRSL